MTSYVLSIVDVTKTGSGEGARGTGNCEMGSKQRIGNEVTDRAGFKLGFVPIFHFLRRSQPFPPLPVLVTSVYCQSMELGFLSVLRNLLFRTDHLPPRWNR